MKQTELIIQNQKGLHARAAALFVQTVEKFRAKVVVSHDDLSVDGDSIMGLMTLGASKGTVLKIRVDGEDETTVIDALNDLINRKFYEEE